ncbi:SRPBCC domain-containing protein [Actinokineospora enzanensis]|uniref:SRPBCC domain-containing protein n=1 Tax=Actinokineospora enzanensis TaxID=155975 RepID=UPI0003A136D1|nr:SRPBCC domain-containing protein [Actinokineospora enzanensis]
MRLEHRFTVPADLDTVWAAVLDPERVAPCLPGAALTGVAGTAFSGTVKVKLGPISLLYKGSGEFLERDADARRIVIKASGKDSRGNGTANATVTVTLSADGDTTVGRVDTDLAITGKPAQFGRGLIAEVGGKILDAFAANLAEALTTPAASVDAAAGPEPSEPEPAESVAAPPPDTEGNEQTDRDVPETREATETRDPQDAESAPESETATPRPLRAVSEAEPIDLMELAGKSTAKRLLPILVVALVIALVIARRRR